MYQLKKVHELDSLIKDVMIMKTSFKHKTLMMLYAMMPTQDEINIACGKSVLTYWRVLGLALGLGPGLGLG